MGLQSVELEPQDSHPPPVEEEVETRLKRDSEEDSPVKVKSGLNGLRKTGLNGTTLKRSISLHRHPFFKKQPKLNSSATTAQGSSPEKVSFSWLVNVRLKFRLWAKTGLTK